MSILEITIRAIILVLDSFHFHFFCIISLFMLFSVYYHVASFYVC